MSLFLDDVREYLRVTGTDHDVEISDLIGAAQADLVLSGVKQEKAQDTSDPLIRRAILSYVAAYFDWDTDGSDRLLQSYVMLKGHLTMSDDYRG